MAHQRTEAVLASAFGREEGGVPEALPRIGGARLARLLHARERGGCSRCFPHGVETTNATSHKNTRSWKHRRATRFR